MIPITDVSQLATSLVNGGALVFAVWLVIYQFRAMEKREAVLTANAERREETVRTEARAREEMTRTEARAREAELVKTLSVCAEKMERMTAVMTRLETWLKRTDD